MSASDPASEHGATNTLNRDVWGGSLLRVTFDPVTHECVLTTEIVDDAKVSQHVLACGGVTELRFDNAIPEPWHYAEITEVHAQYDPLSQQWLIELMLWSENSALTVRCGQLAVDGQDQAPPTL